MAAGPTGPSRMLNVDGVSRPRLTRAAEITIDRIKPRAMTPQVSAFYILAERFLRNPLVVFLVRQKVAGLRRNFSVPARKSGRCFRARRMIRSAMTTWLFGLDSGAPRWFRFECPLSSLTVVVSFSTGRTAKAFRTIRTSRMHLRGENIRKYVGPVKRNSNLPLKVKDGLMARFRSAVVDGAPGRRLRTQLRPRVGPSALNANSHISNDFLKMPELASLRVARSRNYPAGARAQVDWSGWNRFMIFCEARVFWELCPPSRILSLARSDGVEG